MSVGTAVSSEGLAGARRIWPKVTYSHGYGQNDTGRCQEASAPHYTHLPTGLLSILTTWRRRASLREGERERGEERGGDCDLALSSHTPRFRNILLVTPVAVGGLPWMPTRSCHTHLYFTGGKTEAWRAPPKAPQTFCEVGPVSGCPLRHPWRHLRPCRRSAAVQ